MAFEGDGGAAGGDVGGAADLVGGAAGAAGGAADGGASGGDAGGEGGAGGGAGDQTPEWFGNVSDKPGEGETASNRDWLSSKGFKDLDTLVKSYREAETTIRAGNKVKLPGADAKPEEISAFRTAIGVPEKADGYEIAAIPNGKFDPSQPEGPDNPKNIPMNEPLVAALRESAIKHGAPKAAFEGLFGDFVKLQLEEAAAQTAKQDALASDWVKAQGAKADEQLAHVNTAARSLGFSKADMAGLRNGLGADRALTILAKLGAGMAEDVMLTGGSNRFGISGAEAQAEIDKLKGDADFQAKVMKKDSPERARWDRLNKIAADYHAAKES
ncbi:hypothetical protein [Sphingomonas sp.]|uniref:hypothetical protein n=1 Tax=Sphingomonas sp. TaxID=28214 RepID=UPI00257C34EE|nr:hypothetical protein [Sphingomonas sp.]